MAEINESFLDHEGPTDVITFDYRDEPAMPGEDVTVGEIIICPQVAAESCQEHGTTMSEELMLYAVHGFLHLAGYDDHEPADRHAMRAAEQQVMTPLLQDYSIHSMMTTGNPATSHDERSGDAATC